ncbi:arylsulfatase [Roseateles toxinivorans]|uniref:Arylsulfatase/uncharacterized sulfatase n=1 Tax=Roseateles toxinivorans TaxID=270368 RepID=A0A4R6QMK7_9BURK|nr:arylsulfatase [Roseateles toxinivorans]TDP63485.1 arylsulfatase/uncharacterized sulfatase [Roseateles toxinivorans]
MPRRLRHLLLALLAACAGAVAAQPQRPNIVLLLADDWGFSDVGAFGGEIATPHLDELARRGMRFSNFHVTASCSPTRAMLLTGVDNHRNGVGNMRETIPQSHVGKPGYLSVLDRNVVTVASLLRDGGYRTYVAGKWHVGKEPHNLPPARGFDRSLVQGDSGSDNWETGKRYLDLTDRVYWYEDGKETVMPADFYSSQFYVDKTIEYLKADAAQAKPFFAYIGFQSNHIPLQAPAEFIAKYRGFYKNGWAALRQARRDKAVALGLVPASTQLAPVATTTDWDALSDADKAYQARRMEVYAAMAEAMDFHVGRLVAHLKATGAYDNTVFLFLSDNGAEGSDPYAVTLGRWWLDRNYRRDIDSLGAKGAYTVIGPSWGSAATSPLSTYKFYAGEGGLRVPLIVAGVPGMPANRIQPDFTHVSDIVPTLLDLAGVARPGTTYQGRPVEPLTGTSLLPALTGAAGPVHGPDEPIGYELSGNQALFKGDLKLVKNLPPLGDGQWHLYDIRQDPGETRDLQQQRPEAFRAMQADYAAYAKANGVLPMPEGYEPTRQVLINALVNVYVPRLALPALALLGLITLLIWKLRRRRRQRPS